MHFLILKNVKLVFSRFTVVQRVNNLVTVEKRNERKGAREQSAWGSVGRAQEISRSLSMKKKAAVLVARDDDRRVPDPELGSAGGRTMPKRRKAIQPDEQPVPPPRRSRTITHRCSLEPVSSELRVGHQTLKCPEKSVPISTTAPNYGRDNRTSETARGKRASSQGYHRAGRLT